MTALIEFIRKSLSTPKNPQTDLVMRLGFAPKLVSLLDSTSEKIRKEAAWTITNIAAGKTEYCFSLRSMGVIPKLLNLLNDPKQDIKEQVLLLVVLSFKGYLGARKFSKQ